MNLRLVAAIAVRIRLGRPGSRAVPCIHFNKRIWDVAGDRLLARWGLRDGLGKAWTKVWGRQIDKPLLADHGRGVLALDGPFFTQKKRGQIIGPRSSSFRTYMTG